MAAKRETRKRPAPANTPTIVILSGGTGRTAESVARAALAQFDDKSVRIVRKGGIRNARDAKKVVRNAAEEGAVLCHTLVDPDVRDGVVREIERQMIPAIDLLGPALTVLEDYLGRSPQGRPGLSYELNREQFDRMDAVDFTLAHDDGARLHEADQADVVLVGVSRVAKSVTCFYLAYRGVRAANVPIISGIPLPEELVRLDPRKVVGLSMNAQRLQALRSARLPRMATGRVEHYVDPQTIADELRHARHVMNEHGWRCIDVSYMSVEEVAREVMHMIGR